MILTERFFTVQSEVVLANKYIRWIAENQDIEIISVIAFPYTIIVTYKLKGETK